MVLSIIVAAAENSVIGRDNGLIWHLSGDLKHFKAITTGHTVVMGRKTFQSMGRALPNRRTIVISRNPSFVAKGCELVDSIEKALELAKDEEEVFIIGGGTIYRELWDQADRLYLTVVHTVCDGDTKIPSVDPGCWEKEGQEDFPADEKNEFAYSFINYRSKKK